MKAAVLCNGPSKELYKGGYDFVIGCNIPWTDVNATVVLDTCIIDLWSKNLDLIKVPTYFSVDAWRKTDSIKMRENFRPYFKDIIKPKFPFHSSGHNALEITIGLGYTDISIYGCDSWFTDNTQSYTRKYIKNAGSEHSIKHIIGWRKRWNEIISNNPQVNIQFIGYNE